MELFEKLNDELNICSKSIEGIQGDIDEKRYELSELEEGMRKKRKEYNQILEKVTLERRNIISKNPDKSFAWCLLPLRVDDMAHCKDGCLATINGPRIHFIKTDMKEGFYDESGYQGAEGKFHDWRKVLSEALEYKDFVALNFIVGTTRDDLSILLINGVEYYFNAEYLEDALSARASSSFIVHYKDKNHAVVISYDDKTAIIMPMRRP